MTTDDGDALWDGYEDASSSISATPVPGTLYGVERVQRPDVIVWAGSAREVIAIRECGYPQVVALIPDRSRDIFAPLRDHAELLSKAEKIILASGDAVQVEELARRLGRHRCWTAAWLQGCRDALETAQAVGMQGIRDALEGAAPYPIAGIYKPSGKAMLQHRHAPPPLTLTTGCEATDKVMRLPGEGKLMVVTGVPNHGKSTWLTHVMAHTADRHGRRWAVFSPEFGEWQHLAAQVITWRSGKSFRPTPAHPSMSDLEILDGADWCSTRFAFLACDGEDDAPTLDWLIDRARACVLRYGTTDFVIDPWNEIEHDEAGRSETAYIGRALQRLRAFAARHGCNVWIVAHPTKLKPMKPGEPVPVPTAYDINGGANWANKADMIVVVHCPESVTQIHLLKARFRRWGRRGAIAELEFDPLTGRFRSASVECAVSDRLPNGD